MLMSNHQALSGTGREQAVTDLEQGSCALARFVDLWCFVKLLLGNRRQHPEGEAK